MVFFYNLSDRLVFEIRERGIEVYVYGIYIGKKADKFKIYTEQRHIASGSVSNLLVKGVFFDQSSFVYQGLVRIEKDAQESFAYQKNQNLILSDKAFVDSRPFLEILANQVYCTHGSTTGGLNKEEIYYLQTRGISYKKAEEMLIKGFIIEVFNFMEEKGKNLRKDIAKIKREVIDNLN